MEVTMSNHLNAVKSGKPDAVAPLHNVEEVLASRAPSGSAEIARHARALDEPHLDAAPSGVARVFSGCGFWSE